MSLDRYIGTDRVLDKDFMLAGNNVRDKIRKEEKRLLRLNFKVWKPAFYSKLPGWKMDTPVFVMHGKYLAGGAYVCDQNEFWEKGWGQMHYNYIAPAYKGRGAFRILFNEVMSKAAAWNLEGIIINTDRFLHPELYERWGANVWKIIDK